MDESIKSFGIVTELSAIAALDYRTLNPVTFVFREPESSLYIATSATC